jgi:hypothetical protein
MARQARSASQQPRCRERPPAALFRPIAEPSVSQPMEEPSENMRNYWKNMQESAGCSSKRMAHVCHRDTENATQNTPRTTKEQNDERKRNRLRN